MTDSNSHPRGAGSNDYSNVVLRSASAVVHLEYDPSILPSLSDVAERQGGGEWTRFVCISDTHSKAFRVPDGDVLLHSGDLTNTGTVQDFKKTMDWLYSLPHKKKIIIAGNHDLTLHADWYADEWERWHSRLGKQDVESIKEMLVGPAAIEARITYLMDEEYKFQTKEGGRVWSVYGSPWSPEFFNWAFNYDRDKAGKLISRFPNTDILLTHGPPANILDRTRHGDLVGCSTLTSHLAQGRLRPRLHVFGHIHEAHGAHIHTWQSEGPCKALQVQNDLTNAPTPSQIDGRLDMHRTVFVNAANAPMGKRDGRRVDFGGPGYQPVVVDLRDDSI